MTSYKEYCKKELKRCREILKTLDDPQRILIAKDNIRRLQITIKTKRCDMVQSVELPADIQRKIGDNSYGQYF